MSKNEVIRIDKNKWKSLVDSMQALFGGCLVIEIISKNNFTEGLTQLREAAESDLEAIQAKIK